MKFIPALAAALLAVSVPALAAPTHAKARERREAKASAAHLALPKDVAPTRYDITIYGRRGEPEILRPRGHRADGQVAHRPHPAQRRRYRLPKGLASR